MDQHPDTQRSSLLARIECLDRELQDLRRELDQAQRLATLGTLAGSIAHEFNNILTPLLSYAQLAIGYPQDAELAEKALRKTVESAQRASNIASALLGFASDDGGPVGADIGEAARAAIVCMAREPARDGVRVSLDIQPGLRAAIRPVSLQHVLLNLALNAVEAMKPGGGLLTIRARPTPHAPPTPSIPSSPSSVNRPHPLPNAENDVHIPSRGGKNCSSWNNSQHPQRHHEATSTETPCPSSTPKCCTISENRLEIEVSDTGRGVPPDMLERVMSPFVTNRDPTVGRQGVGLGLAICRRLVENAGGVIHIESVIGDGTTLRIILPTDISDCKNSTSVKERAA